MLCLETAQSRFSHAVVWVEGCRHGLGAKRGIKLALRLLAKAWVSLVELI